MNKVFDFFISIGTIFWGSRCASRAAELRSAKEQLRTEISNLSRFDGKSSAEYEKEIERAFREIDVAKFRFFSYRKFFYKKKNQEIENALNELRNYYLEDSPKQFNMAFSGIDTNYDNNPIHKALKVLDSTL